MAASWQGAKKEVKKPKNKKSDANTRTAEYHLCRLNIHPRSSYCMMHASGHSPSLYLIEKIGLSSIFSPSHRSPSNRTPIIIIESRR
jgi:hypothetical protein